MLRIVLLWLFGVSVPHAAPICAQSPVAPAVPAHAAAAAKDSDGQGAAKSGKKPVPSIAKFVAELQHLPGFVDIYADEEAGKLYLHLTAFDQDVLYATANASGLGSNPIGLDRGSLGPQHVVHFHRAGAKVLVLARNLKFRALSKDPGERRAVAESFAPAVLAALPVVAKAVTEEGGEAVRSRGGVLVDATDWFVRDATGASRRMAGDGASYRLDKQRSALWLERTKAFPDNSEIEVLLTFASERPRGEVATAAADAKAVTLRQHHSLIRLPALGAKGAYQPRRADPRVGFFGPSFQDYAAPLGGSLHQRWIARHHLVKKEPAEAVSEAVEPIVYYVDRATPEPVRSALIEGASWWSDAFLSAGFRDAFRVELLPDGADPMDVRYHVIHWVHRRTRGWSYGSSITDPRTGQILKGNVLLGSLRVRQDHLKFVGLQGPYAADGACRAGASPGASHLIVGDDGLAQKIALMRIRQLAAHEVGHTLGLSHNFAASSYGRASVMDYPAPLVFVDGEELDFSTAYDTGIGDYDRWAIVYGYSQFRDDQNEAEQLKETVQAGLRQGYVFLTDQDARGVGTSHPLASLWDNGADAIEQLQQELQVRQLALRRFGIDALRPGQSLASLEDALVPLYLHHRFQLEAVLKLIGGVDFRHAVKGDGQTANTRVSLDRQRRALEVVLRTLQPEFLRLDPRMLERIPPAPPGHPATAERFPRATGQPLDPVAMAANAVELTLHGLLHRERLARLIHRDDGDGLSLRDICERLEQQAFGAPSQDVTRYGIEQRIVQQVLVDRLLELSGDARVAADVRATLAVFLERIADHATVRGQRFGREDWLAAGRERALSRRIRNFLERDDVEARRMPSLPLPPGSPIGAGR
ncbi:MAG: zinc-dependent metalloprotease [Planctomycetota bacterium]